MRVALCVLWMCSGGSEWVDLLSVSLPEHARVQLADGALVDILCSVYSVSCKVLNLRRFFSYQQFNLNILEGVGGAFS